MQRAGDAAACAPGPVLLRFAQRGVAGDDSLALAEPSLEHLAARSGETSTSPSPARSGAEHARPDRDSRHLLGTDGWVGRRGVPLHAAAYGKVFLAFGAMHLPPGELAPFAPRTITDRAAARGRAGAGARRGYATAVDELEHGLAAIAAPVRGAVRRRSSPRFRSPGPRSG